MSMPQNKGKNAVLSIIYWEPQAFWCIRGDLGPKEWAQVLFSVWAQAEKTRQLMPMADAIKDMPHLLPDSFDERVKKALK